MADLKQMSNEELLRIAKSRSAQPSSTQKSVRDMSDDELMQLAGVKSKVSNATQLETNGLRVPSTFQRQAQAEMPKNPFPTIGEQIAENVKTGVAEVGRAYDSFTGAPTRAFLDQLAGGQNVIEAAKAFKEQFGEDPSLAPTGRELALRFGVKEGEKLKLPIMKPDGTLVEMDAPSAYGVAIDILADPLNVIPGTSVLKGGTKLGTTMAIKGGKAVKALTPGAVRRGANEAVKALDKFFAQPIKGVAGHFTPKQAPDFAELVAIAQKHGIEPRNLPETTEFGKNSFLGRADKIKRAGPAGQDIQQNFVETLTDVRDALTKQLAEIGLGDVPTPEEAGEILRAGVREARKNLLKQADVTYQSVANANPGLKLTDDAFGDLTAKTALMRDRAEDLIESAVTPALEKAQARNMIAAIDAIENSNGDFGDLVDKMQKIGKVAWPERGRPPGERVPPDIQSLRQLYGDIREAVFETIDKSVSKEAAKKLEANNKVLSEFFGENKILARAIDDDALADEKLFKRFVLSDSRRLEAVKNVVGPDVMQKLKAAAIASFLKPDDQGVFSFATLANKIQAQRDVLRRLYEPEELAEITDIVRLGESFGPITINPPGEGASGFMSKISESIWNAVENNAITEIMKARARGMPTPGGRGGQAAGPLSGFTRQTDEAPILLRRFRQPTLTDTATKGAQVLSVPESAERRDERINALLRRSRLGAP